MAISELSPEELQDAVALAAKLQSASSASSMAEAVSTIQQDRVRSRRRSFKQRALILGSIILALLVADMAFAFHHTQKAVSAPNQTALPAQAESLLAIKLPPAESSIISGIPIQGEIPAGLKSVSNDVQTSITFKNQLGEPVLLSWIDYKGKEQLLTTIGPGQTREQMMSYFSVFVISDKARTFRRLYFSQGRPMTAIIDNAPQGKIVGYWPAVGKDAILAQTQTDLHTDNGMKSPTGISMAYISIVNMTPKPINLYRVMSTGFSQFDKTLESGGFEDVISTHDTSWTVTDFHGNVVARYPSPPISRVAVILPANGTIVVESALSRNHM